MKINPRKLALAGLIGALVSGITNKSIISFIDPESPDAKIVIPLATYKFSEKNIENGKIVSITTGFRQHPAFIPNFINVYIVLLVAGTLYNKKEF